MSLIFGIICRHINRIIRKLCNPLEAGRTESADSGRIKIGIEIVRRIKFINQTRLFIETFQIGERNIVSIYRGQEVSFTGMSGNKTHGIPLISSTLNGSIVVSLNHMLIVADIIEYRFPVACTFQGR